MKQILWFRRDLRIRDSAILNNMKGEVLPIFIFDKNILDKLDEDDKRVFFIYKTVLKLKKQLKSVGLDLALFYDKPKEVFLKLKPIGFDEILCSCDFDDYSKKRDYEIENIIPIKRFYDSFLITPWEICKKDKTPYRMFTPFYKSLDFIWKSTSIPEFEMNKKVKLIDFDYSVNFNLNIMGFKESKLPLFMEKNPAEILNKFKYKLTNYSQSRDFFNLEGTSNLSIYLRYGLISPRELFNKIKSLNNPQSDIYIRQLFWREFYNYILFHYPNSQFENFNGLKIKWNSNKEEFKRWCNGNTGVPIVDAAMRHFNKTGLMHNRLRMIVASYLCKNLLIDWRKGEEYFASKLLDYECSSNVGSWQWAASTGADSVPYFRIFNPYTQSQKFDKNALFIKSVITELEDIDSKLIHKESISLSDLFINYPKQMVSIQYSRSRALEVFKGAKYEKL